MSATALTSLLFLPFLLSPLLILVAGDEAFIKHTCNQTQDYGFCVITLEEDERSYCADLTGLDSISIELGIKNATSTKSFVAGLLENTTDPYTRACLKDCELLYSDAKSSLKSSLTALMAKKYPDANIMISAAMTDADTCESQFRQSPMTKQNQDLSKLGSLALDILKIITN